MEIMGSARLMALESSTLYEALESSTLYDENDGNLSITPSNTSDPREVLLLFHLKGLISFHVSTGKHFHQCRNEAGTWTGTLSNNWHNCTCWVHMISKPGLCCPGPKPGSLVLPLRDACCHCYIKRPPLYSAMWFPRKAMFVQTTAHLPVPHQPALLPYFNHTSRSCSGLITKFPQVLWKPAAEKKAEMNQSNTSSAGRAWKIHMLNISWQSSSH